MLIENLRYAFIRRTYPLVGTGALRNCANAFDYCMCNDHAVSCSLNYQIDLFCEGVMKQARKNSSKNNQWTTEFVQYSLSSDDKKDFIAWQKKHSEELDDMVIGLLQTGHKIGYSFSDTSDSFIVSVTGRPEGCNNAGKCFTSHAKDYGTALWVALYKHYVIWGNGVWEAIADEVDFG